MIKTSGERKVEPHVPVPRTIPPRLDWATEAARRLSRRPTGGERTPAWRNGWMWWILLNLGVVAVFGAWHGVEPDSQDILESSRYKAYDLRNLPESLPLHDARLYNGILIMTVEDRWFALSHRDRHSLMKHLRSGLLGQDGIEQIVLIDKVGRQVAFATKDQLDAVPGGQ